MHTGSRDGRGGEGRLNGRGGDGTEGMERSWRWEGKGGDRKIVGWDVVGWDGREDIWEVGREGNMCNPHPSPIGLLIYEF